MTDPTLYRVNLLCSCNADMAVGYGPTKEAAQTAAVGHFRRAHGRRAKWREVIVEKAVTTARGSSHYEPYEEHPDANLKP